MLESQQECHSQLLFDDPSFDTDALAAAALLGVGRTRLSQMTSAGTLPHLRRKVGDRFRIFYRRTDIEKRIAARFAYAQVDPNLLKRPAGEEVAPLSDGRSGASADLSNSTESLPLSRYNRYDELPEGAKAPELGAMASAPWDREHDLSPKPHLGTRGALSRRPLVSAIETERKEKVEVALQDITTLLETLLDRVAQLEADHVTAQEQDQFQRRELQKQLHALSRMLLGQRSPNHALFAYTHGHEPLKAQTKADPHTETRAECRAGNRAKTLRLKANALRRSHQTSTRNQRPSSSF